MVAKMKGDGEELPPEEVESEAESAEDVPSFRQQYYQMFTSLAGDRDAWKLAFQDRLDTDADFRRAFIADSYAHRINELASDCARRFRSEMKAEAIEIGTRPTTGADKQRAMPGRESGRAALVRTLFDNSRLYNGTLYGDATIADLTDELEHHLRDNLIGAARHGRWIFTTRELMLRRNATPDQRVRDVLVVEEAQHLLDQAEKEGAARAERALSDDM